MAATDWLGVAIIVCVLAILGIGAIAGQPRDEDDDDTSGWGV